jgi:cytoskeletal protein CcmA (bactofilin family)
MELAVTHGFVDKIGRIQCVEIEIQRVVPMFRSGREEGRDTPERVTSVLGEGISWQGKISGAGGVRIEGAFDGEIEVRGLVVIAERGRVSCDHIRAETVIIAGSLKGDITAQKVQISSTGRVWGSVITKTFSTDEGAFLKGQITMEDEIELGIGSVDDDLKVEEKEEE